MHTQNHGAIAQLVEQRTENPCVPGSIPGGTTKKTAFSGLFCIIPKATYVRIINIPTPTPIRKKIKRLSPFYFFTREKVMIASSSFGNNLQLKVENCIRI